MKFDTIQLASMLYAIPYINKPIVYSLVVKSVNKKKYLGNNTYTFEVVFPNGSIKYLQLHDGYVNNPNGDDISQPFINRFSTYPEWQINSSEIEEDKIQYLIYDDRNELIDEYIKQFEDKINYDQITIHNLTNEIIRNQQTIDYIKHQKI